MLHRDPGNGDAQIVLASASPRRRALLGLLGVSFSVLAADVDEHPLPGEPPEELTTRLARSKALAVVANGSAWASARVFPDESRDVGETDRANRAPASVDRLSTTSDPVVLGADTAVVLGSQILGKPADEAEARAMLAALRGRAHRVLTGVALVVGGEIAWSGVVETAVWMREYRADEVDRYVRSGRPLDKAGAYGIQDADFRPVEWTEGCYANVVGLPLCEVRRALAALDPDRVWGPGWRTARSGEAADEHAVCERARALS
jgi:septum formation protein